MANTSKHFLDHAGLTTLWSIIKNRFADKSAAVTSLKITTSTDGKTQTLVGPKVDSDAAPASVELPKASRDQAGLMSPDHYAAVADLQTNIDKFAPFAGLQLGTKTDKNEVSLIGRKATIGLKYITEKSNDGTTNHAYIALLDPTYPETGRWEEVSAEVFNAATDKTSYAAVKGENLTYSYYVWTNANEGATPTPAGVAGPVNALGEPIYNQPISKIDVTELVKTGLLLSSDVVINPDGQGEGTFLKLVFNSFDENGDSSPQTTYINVTDLVEVYKAGEGVSISHTGTTMDDTRQEGTISLLAATENDLGGIRIGYTEGNKTYAVKFDTNKHAYVAVPWNETIVAANSQDVDSDGNKYLEVECSSSSVVSDLNNSTTTTYVVNVEAGAGIKSAEALARTGIQQIAGDANYINISAKESLQNKGSKVTITLDDTAKASLALADSAVQGISAVQYVNTDRPLGTENGTDIVVTVKDADVKGQKSYTVGLGTRTKDSLNLADSAVQSINMMGTELNKDSKAYTAAQAKLAMAIGTAAGVNITSDGTLETKTSDVNGPGDAVNSKDTVPTTTAVKTYIDNTKADITQNYQSMINSTIANLDSDITAGEVAAGDTAQNLAAQRVFTSIVITDGKLDANNSQKRPLYIKDISDFRPLNEDEIKSICEVVE